MLVQYIISAQKESRIYPADSKAELGCVCSISFTVAKESYQTLLYIEK